ncbi:uncharacterized protein LOC144179871 [Haemaphysalis longicornis]
MSDLPPLLNDIPGLKHSIYADDITLWCHTGSPGTQEETLQRGIDVVTQYTASIGLVCSPEKTEYTVVIGSRKAHANDIRALIRLHLNGKEIPRKHSIRILGFHIDQDGTGTTWLKTITTQANQILHMINRVSRSKYGLKEHEGRKVVEALLISRIMYGLPYYYLTKTQHTKLEVILRNATRIITGTPRFTQNDLLYATGALNTLSEKIDTHHLAQTQRLQTSPQGRLILLDLGHNISQLQHIPPEPPPWSCPANITLKPIPKNMGPDQASRRADRANHYNRKTFSPGTTVIYTDAAYNKDTKIGTTAFHSDVLSAVAKYAPAPSSTSLELQAIVNAIEAHQDQTELVIITDSKSAIRNLRENHMHPHMRYTLASITRNHPELHTTVIWVPGHAGVKGNEKAHALARAALFDPGTPIPWPRFYDPKEHRREMHQTRRKYLRDVRDQRTTLPYPRKFARPDAVLIRRAQTGTLPTQHIQHYIDGLPGTPKCSHCDQYPNNEHTLWTCPNIQSTLRSSLQPIPATKRPTCWEAWVTPPKELEELYWTTLVHHVKNTPGL